MMNFTQITIKLLNSKRHLAYIFLAILILLITLILEANFNDFSPPKKISYFSVDSKFTNSIRVAYSNPPEFLNFESNKISFPHYIKSLEPVIVNFYGDTFTSLKPETTLRTINFQKKRLHLELIGGETLFDNRASKFPVTFQVKNIFIQPYTKGVYLINQDEVVSLIGSSLVGVYENKKLQKILTLPKGASYRISNSEISQIRTFKEYTDFYTQNSIFISLNKYLANQELFSLKYKGQLIDPANDPLQASFLNAAILNPTKKQYKQFYGFVENLRLAEIAYISGSDSVAESHLEKAKQYYLDSIVRDPSNIQKYTLYFNDHIASMLGVHLSEDIYPIKTFLITLLKNHSNKVYLSLLEDLDQSYAVLNPQNIELILSYLISYADSENIKKISPRMIDILEGMSNRYDIAYNLKHYELREKLSKNLIKNSDKQLFNLNTKKHLSKLKQLFEASALPNNEIRSLVEFLLKTVNQETQLEYQDFLLELSN